MKALHDVLERHKGPDQAISSGELASRLGISDSEANPTTRFEIRELIERTGLPVAANNQGYYMIETERQKDEYLARLNQRIVGIEERKRLVEKAWRGEIEQGTLDGEGWSE